MKKTFMAVALISSALTNSPAMASGKDEAGMASSATSELAPTQAADVTRVNIQEALPPEALDLIITCLAQDRSVPAINIGGEGAIIALYDTSELFRALVVKNTDAQGVLFGLRPNFPDPDVQYKLDNPHLVDFSFSLNGYIPGNTPLDDVSIYIRRARHSMMHLRAWAEGFEWRKIANFTGAHAMPWPDRFATIKRISDFAIGEFNNIKIDQFFEGLPDEFLKTRVLQQERKSLLGLLACKTMVRISLENMSLRLSGADFLGSYDDLTNLVNALDECYANRALTEEQKARASVMACGLVALLNYMKVASVISEQTAFYDKLLNSLFRTTVKYKLRVLSPSFLNINGTLASFNETNM